MNVFTRAMVRVSLVKGGMFQSTRLRLLDWNILPHENILTLTFIICIRYNTVNVLTVEHACCLGNPFHNAAKFCCLNLTLLQ